VPDNWIGYPWDALDIAAHQRAADQRAAIGKTVDAAAAAEAVAPSAEAAPEADAKIEADGARGSQRRRGGGGHSYAFVTYRFRCS
jgi:hypothetical protein